MSNQSWFWNDSCIRLPIECFYSTISLITNRFLCRCFFLSEEFFFSFDASLIFFIFWIRTGSSCDSRFQTPDIFCTRSSSLLRPIVLFFPYSSNYFAAWISQSSSSPVGVYGVYMELTSIGLKKVMEFSFGFEISSTSF